MELHIDITHILPCTYSQLSSERINHLALTTLLSMGLTAKDRRKYTADLKVCEAKIMQLELSIQEAINPSQMCLF